MTRERDAFDMFQQQEQHDRGRFGDNELARERLDKRQRVTGASDLVDLDLIHHTDAATPKAVKVSYGDIKRAVWLARSLIEIVPTGEVKRIYAGRFDQTVRVTLPEWLAKEKRLI